MAYMQSSIHELIREDLERMEGRREVVRAGLLEKMLPKKVKPSELHVNPDDEFSFPNIGPNDAIIENYSEIARRQDALGANVFEEPINVNKLKADGYLILNGHHRWAGAIRARVATVRIKVLDP